MENRGYINHGEHFGDVRFEHNGIPPIMPIMGQTGSMCCPRRGCGHAIWSDSVQCPYCHFDMRAYWQKEGCKQDLQRLKGKLNIVEWVSLTCAGLMLIMLYLKSIGFATLALFFIFALCVSIASSLDERVAEVQKKLKEFDYLAY
ncbi:hypothetical protein [Moraxella lacunata]|uniref:hypothetical protein n=1 Tax=Moraxella lacunata TaxID=477 RepID=UPI003EDEDC66